MRVDELMQPPPAQAAEPAHHAVGRGRGQHRQPEPGGAADDEIPAMRDLVGGLAEVVALVGEKQRQMRGDVAKGADAEHAADVDQVAVAQDAAERRHRQRHPEKHQRPEPGAMNEVIDRPRAVINGRRRRTQPWPAVPAAAPARRCAAATIGRAGQARLARTPSWSAPPASIEWASPRLHRRNSSHDPLQRFNTSHCDIVIILMSNAGAGNTAPHNFTRRLRPAHDILFLLNRFAAAGAAAVNAALLPGISSRGRCWERGGAQKKL